MYEYSLIKLFLAVSSKDISQSDRSILHLVNHTVDLNDNIVVEHLENHCSDQTEEGCQERNLHPTCYECRADITCSLDSIERLDKTNNGTHKSE